MTKEYKDQFTLDGRLKPVAPYVTRAKVEAADRLIQKALQGDKIASGSLAEVMTTSDLKFNVAHLVTAIVMPQFDGIERTWSQVAGTRTVPDFGPVRLQSLFGDMTGPGVNERGGLNRVPEAAPYPYVSVSGQEALYAKIAKMGAKFGFSWESNVNDVVGFFENIPGELLELVLDTEEREVYDALIAGTTNHLAQSDLPDGTTVAADAPLTPEAIWAAILQLANVEVNGRKVGRASAYRVVVPVGVKDFIEWKMNQTIISIQDGSVTYGPGDRSALNGVTFVESEFITGTQWIIIPAPGSLRRPILELGRLRGYESPELRVHNDTGVYVGGSAVSPFEGNFDNDTIDYRVRYVCGGIMWSSAYSLISDGDGTVV